LADELGCLVVSIDYRLAPEYRFPVALEESYDVVKWAWEAAAELGIDRSRIALCGHSAGGNLAAGITLLARERREFSVCYQILDYPPLDLTRDPAEKTRVPRGSKILPPALCRIFDRCYIGSHEDARNPLVSPVWATDLKGLPPALVITAEQDSLAEEAERYADMLAAAGVPVVKKMFVGAAHGFTLYPGELAQQAWELMKLEMGKAFAC
jgi:acetyl esterase